MNWFKELIAASGCTTELYTGPDGVEYIAVNGNVFQKINGLAIKDQLNRVGFFWRGGPKWRMPAQQFNANINAQQLLRTLNIPFGAAQQPIQPTLAPTPPVQNNVDPIQQTPNNWYHQNVKWYLATMLDSGKPIAMSKNQNGGWDWVDEQGAKGQILPDAVNATVKSVRDQGGKPYSSPDPQQLFQIFKSQSGVPGDDVTKEQDAESPVPQPVDPKTREAGMIPEKKMSTEQRAIDSDFAQTNDSIMIDALAGSGKTTMLKHLAWKYGNGNQKWLYMVFNTKNKVEAKQKFPSGWVVVNTTNGFLGSVLDKSAKMGRVPSTQRIKSLEPKGTKNKADRVPDKVDLLLDGPTFGGMMRQFGLVTPPKGALNNYDQYQQRALDSLLRKIRGDFRKAVKTLADLSKSFAVDPRKPDVRKRIAEVMSKYDIDHSLSEVKEKISKYKEPFKSQVIHNLNAILGFDFMGKTLEQECIQAAEWMLKECLPGASRHVFNYQGKQHTLGQYRDFSDDLWFAAIDSDKMDWSGYTHVLADEVQDFNECQKIALANMRGKKVVAVGDPNQSIYRFRGADSQAFGKIGEMLGSKKHSLSQNFRSRPAIIAFSNANTHVKNLKAGLKISPEEIAEFLKTYTTNPEDQEYMQQAQQVIGQVDANTLKAAIDGGQLPWPPRFNGQATRDTKEYDNIFAEISNERKLGKNTQTAFISRTNAPLANAALKLLGAGTPFVIVGKDIANDLLSHVDKMLFANFKGAQKLSDSSSIDDLSNRLPQHLEEELNMHGNKASKKGYLQDLADTTTALTACIEQFSPGSGHTPSNGNDNNFYDDDDHVPAPTMMQPKQKTIGDFKSWLKQKLGGLDLEQSESDVLDYMEHVEKDKKNAPVVLTTAHKSKGLEFERVFVLRDDLFPHPRAKRSEDLEQEGNAKYVTYTRAMNELHVVKLEGQPGYQKR